MVCSLSCAITGTENELFPFNVRCIATAGADIQQCYIYRTVSRDDNPSYDLDVPDADVVMINSRGDQRVFSFYADSAHSSTYYRSDSGFSLSENETFWLRVKQGNITLNGEATVPGNFKILSITNRGENENHTYTIDVMWQKSNNSAIYQVKSIVPFTNNGHLYYEERLYETRDTSISFALDIPFQNRDSVLVQVTALDDNYYDATSLHYQQVGIDNGIGFVGAGIIQSKKFKIQ